MQAKSARKKVTRLPRKQKKRFVIVKGANEYHYQRLLLQERRFKFMSWKTFEIVTKQHLKHFLRCQKNLKN